MPTPRRFVLESKPSHATRVLCKVLENLRTIFMKLVRGFFLLNRCLSATQMLNRCYVQVLTLQILWISPSFNKNLVIIKIQHLSFFKDSLSNYFCNLSTSNITLLSYIDVLKLRNVTRKSDTFPLGSSCIYSTMIRSSPSLHKFSPVTDNNQVNLFLRKTPLNL
jgi:hypothetical protein